MQAKTTWNDLTADCKHRIWAHIRLDEMLSAIQLAMASRDVSDNIARRIRALQPLRDAWVACVATEVRNLPQYRTPAARRRVLPAEFVTMERLVLDKSPALRGTLPPAVAELADTLKVLHCDGNALDDLPPELARCGRLVNLDASGCQFRRLPEVVLKLRSLRLMTFSENFELGPRLPERLMEALPNLTRLGFYQCSLEVLPASLISTIAFRDHPPILANVSYNSFPYGYLEELCRRFPAFRRRVRVL